MYKLELIFELLAEHQKFLIANASKKSKVRMIWSTNNYQKKDDGHSDQEGDGDEEKKSDQEAE